MLSILYNINYCIWIHAHDCSKGTQMGKRLVEFFTRCCLIELIIYIITNRQTTTYCNIFKITAITLLGI